MPEKFTVFLLGLDVAAILTTASFNYFDNDQVSLKL